MSKIESTEQGYETNLIQAINVLKGLVNKELMHGGIITGWDVTINDERDKTTLEIRIRPLIRKSGK